MSLTKHSNFLFAIILMISIATGVGWFYDGRILPSTSSTLQLPDNIDYYLSKVNYRSMNEKGDVHYLLLTPYLEHYIREDISQIQQPEIQLNGDLSAWLIQATNGSLQHAEEVFELQQEVEMLRNSELDPMRLNTELLILMPRSNLIEIPQHLSLVSSRLNLKADSATLNIDENRYRFNRVKAIHRPATSVRSKNESS